MRQLQNMTPLRRYIRSRFKRCKHFIRELYWRVDGDFVPLASGAIAFFTLLSVFPLLLLAITISLSFIPPARIEMEIAGLTATMGHSIPDALIAQVRSIVNHRGVLTGVASFVGLWTGSQVFVILESAINMVWDSTKKRSFLVRRALAIGMMVSVGTLMLGAILLTYIIRVLGQLAIPLLGVEVWEIPKLVTALITYVVPTLLVSAIFSIAYFALPTKRVTFRTVLPGALFAGILWMISIHVFGWYVIHINVAKRYALFYGSLGGIILLMLWLYYSAYIMLIGAEISATYHHRLVAAGDRQEQKVDEEDQTA